MRLPEYKIPEPGFEKIFRAEVLLKDPFPLGETGVGYQEIVAVSGGRFEGEINGEIMDFGGDWGLLHSSRVNELNTKYLLKTDDGVFISVECSGKLIMEYDDMANVSGEDDGDYYFRQTIRFTTGEEKYCWLNEIVAVAASIITPEGNVCLDVYKMI